jgi:Uma2 family endonuclease
MESIAVQQQPSSNPLSTLKQPRRITWQEFEKRYLGRENGFKYEWVNGVAEKTAYTMGQNQLYIQRNLTAFFRQLFVKNLVGGELLAEPDLILFKEHHRCPDMAWLTTQQIANLAVDGAIEVPAFVIEVVSNNDAASKVADKMKDYRHAGVQVVWHIYPKNKEVHVYFGKNLRQAIVCTGDETCTAAPVLPAFQLTVNEVFIV